MKKSLSLKLMAITVALVLAACQNLVPPSQQADGFGSLSVQLTPQSRTLLPAIDMNPASYALTLTDDQGQSQNPSMSETQATVNGLKPGAWTVKVEALNAQSQVIGQGIKQVTIVAHETVATTVLISPITGTGTLELNLSWPVTDLTAPGIQATLTPTLGSPVILAFSQVPGGASYSSSQLSTGYHTLAVLLKDGQNVRAGAVEVVRLVNGQTTTGSYLFNTLDPMGGVTVNIQTAMADPLSLVITGTASPINLGTTSLFTAAVSNFSENVTFVWYLDGQAVGTGAEYTYNAIATGTKRIDVTAISADGSRAGSASAQATVVQTQAIAWNYQNEPKVSAQTATSYTVSWSALAGATVYEVAKVTNWNPYTIVSAGTTTETSFVTPDYAGYIVIAKNAANEVIDQRVVSAAKVNKSATTFMDLPLQTGTFIENFDGASINPAFRSYQANAAQLVLANGQLTLSQTLTDNGPELCLAYDSGSKRFVDISYRTRLHAGGSYFYGGLNVFNRENSVLLTQIFESTHSEFEPQYGTVVASYHLNRNYQLQFVRNMAPAWSSYRDYSVRTVLSATERMDTWLNVNITLDKLTNAVSVKINNVELGSATVEYQISDKLIMSWNPNGWNTGHTKELDDLNVSCRD